MAKKTKMASFRLDEETWGLAQQSAGAEVNVSEWYRQLGARELSKKKASDDSIDSISRELIEIRSLRNLVESVLSAVADDNLDSRRIYEILKENSLENSVKGITEEIIQDGENEYSQSSKQMPAMENSATSFQDAKDDNNFEDIFSGQKLIVGNYSQQGVTNLQPDSDDGQMIQ